MQRYTRSCFCSVGTPEKGFHAAGFICLCMPHADRSATLRCTQQHKLNVAGKLHTLHERNCNVAHACLSDRDATLRRISITSAMKMSGGRLPSAHPLSGNLEPVLYSGVGAGAGAGVGAVSGAGASSVVSPRRLPSEKSAERTSVFPTSSFRM